MAAVRNLCNRTVVLSGGRAEAFDDVDTGVRQYMAIAEGGATGWTRPLNKPVEELAFKSISVSIVGEQPKLSMDIEVTFAGRTAHRPSMIAFHISNELGINLLHIVPSNEPCIPTNSLQHRYMCRVELPPLIPGRYWVTAWIGPNYSETFEFCPDCVAFDVTHSPLPGRTLRHTLEHGFIVPPSKLLIAKVSSLLAS
jgi:hypothetical protein